MPEATLPAIFKAQAARTPGAVALICGEESLRYAGLNVRANRLARHLRAPGSVRRPWWYCVERSLEMVVASRQLQGGRRLPPAGPDYPRERLTSSSGDARGSLLTRAPAPRKLG